MSEKKRGKLQTIPCTRWSGRLLVLFSWNGTALPSQWARLPGEIWDNILGRLLDGPGQSLFSLILSAPIKVWACV